MNLFAQDDLLAGQWACRSPVQFSGRRLGQSASQAAGWARRAEFFGTAPCRRWDRAGILDDKSSSVRYALKPHPVEYSTVQYSTLLHSIQYSVCAEPSETDAQYSTVSESRSIQHITVQHSTIFHSTVHQRDGHACCYNTVQYGTM